MSELGKVFIIQNINTKVTLPKKGELEKASAIWVEVIERDKLES